LSMAKYKLLLPKMGESVAEATVIRWTKSPGDLVEMDETVMEIATDKVDSDVPSPVSGKLVEQLCKENDVVQVGAVIAIIETADPETAPVAPAPVVEAPKAEPVTASPAPAPVFEAPKPEPVAAPAPVEEPVTPETATDKAPEELVAEVETSQPVVEAAIPAEIPTPEITQPEAPKPPVFAESREEFTPPVPYTEQLAPTELPKTSEPVKTEGRFYSPLVKNIAAQEGISNDELDRIPGTGVEGRLTKDDLLAYLQHRYLPPAVEEPATAPEAESTTEVPAEVETTDTVEPTTIEVPEEPVEMPVEASQPDPALEAPEPDPVFETLPPEPVFEAPLPEPVAEQPKTAPVFEIPKAAPAAEPKKQGPAVSLSGGDEIIEMDRMGRLIAEHMVMSKHTSPHVTSFVEADVTNLVLWREKIKGPFEKREGEKITFTPLFIEAVVRSIKDMPMINVQVNGTQIIRKKDINISMATALPNGNLIVPVIKRADELSIIGLTKAVNDLANRARNNKLKPDDIQGGTFTITNVGSFGNVMGTPIINQPQVAILAVGAIRKKPAVIETLQGDLIGIRHMMFLSLSYDHRVVNGALGGSFVRRIADYLENWDPGREI
jgi:2-oxoglutarate dehydrogenase E2 component (dihydrolipoamide succinyltransferase)